MIIEGINRVKDLILDKDGCYHVELSRIMLPHLPVSRQVLAALKLGKQELTGHFYADRFGEYPGFKVINVTTHFHNDGYQIIRGKVRSVGIGRNLASHLREDRPAELRFMLRGHIGSHEDYLGAFEIKSIVQWTLPHPLTVDQIRTCA